MGKVLDNPITLPARSDSTLMQVSDNVTFRWLHDGQAFAVEIRSSRRDDIDAALNANFAAIYQWDNTQPVYSLQNLSHPDINITPYFKSRLGELEGVVEECGVQGTSIIILNNGFTGQLMKHLLRFFVSRTKGAIQQVVFTDAQEAYAELEKRITFGG